MGGHTAPDDVLAALTAAFADCESELLRRAEDAISTSGASLEHIYAGACAICVLVSPAHLLIANAGDCQALLVRSGRPQWLNSVHNANQLEEQVRLRAAHPGEADIVVCMKGGVVTPPEGAGLHAFARLLSAQVSVANMAPCYVKGRLQPTRSFGDFYLKDLRLGGEKLLSKPVSPPYITAVPEVEAVQRRPQDDAVILASDGLWDYLSGDDVARLFEAAVGNRSWRTQTSAEQREEAAAARTAASQTLARTLVEEVVQRAAQNNGLSEAALLRVPQGPRRKLHDDVTVIAIVF